MCEAEPYPYADAAQLLAPDDALVVALDQVQDPQNLGAVCRSAECAGATGVVMPERRAAEVTPAVCRASAGAVEHLAVARVRNLADFLAQAKQAGAWVYGAEAGAARPYTDVDWTGPGRDRAGLGGRRDPAARAGGLRRARRAARPGPDRVAERVRRGGGAAVRGCKVSCKRRCRDS